MHSVPVKWTPAQIRLLRFRLRLTQQQFADRLGAHRNTIASWERGRRHPALRWQRRLDAVSNGWRPVPEACDILGDERG